MFILEFLILHVRNFGVKALVFLQLSTLLHTVALFCIVVKWRKDGKTLARFEFLIPQVLHSCQKNYVCVIVAIMSKLVQMKDSSWDCNSLASK